MIPPRGALAGRGRPDDELQSRYLAEVLATLYPQPCDIDDWYGDVVAEYLVIPDLRRPRMLVPAGSPRLATAVARRHAAPPSRTARFAPAWSAPAWFNRDSLLTMLRTGAASLLLQDRIRVTAGTGRHRDEVDSIDRYLRDALGEPVRLGVYLGPSRHGRPPLLRVLRPGGQTLGFAKIGAGPPVRGEAMALAKLARAGLRTVRAPRVLHAGAWREHDVTVQSALPVGAVAAPVPGDLLLTAMREVAGCLGVSEGPLATSGYWRRLRDRLARAARDADGRALAGAADLLVARSGDVVLHYGCWHGDWTAAHMFPLDGSLLVWDWERFATGVPLGFDALHHDTAARLTGTRTAGTRTAGTRTAGTGLGEAATGAGTATATIERAGALLAAFEVPAAAARVTALLYLIEMAARRRGPAADPATATGDPATATGDPATATGDLTAVTADPATATADPATATATATGELAALVARHAEPLAQPRPR